MVSWITMFEVLYMAPQKKKTLPYFPSAELRAFCNDSTVNVSLKSTLSLPKF